MAEVANPVTLRPLELADADVIAAWAADADFCLAAGWTIGLAFTEYQHLGMVEVGRGEGSVFMGQRTFYRRFTITAKGWLTRRANWHAAQRAQLLRCT